MVLNRFLVLLTGSVLLASAVDVSFSTTDANAKATKKRTAASSKGKSKARRSSRRGIPQYMIPPPPPYVPGMLPELMYSHATPTKSSQKEVSEGDGVKRYIYNTDGYEPPKPVQSNKYVTYFGKT